MKQMLPRNGKEIGEVNPINEKLEKKERITEKTTEWSFREGVVQKIYNDTHNVIPLMEFSTRISFRCMTPLQQAPTGDVHGQEVSMDGRRLRARVTTRTSPKARTQISAAATIDMTTQSTSGRPVEARNSCPKSPTSAVEPAVKHR